ncbi:hypothetical protein CMI47_04635 [Candidatus Pacearchaeota archaeon]|jgi:hypothetical protein|nr:hypothetical protein [Candidatus Pacearchaeota archaeon]|tara:strand:- start:4834 stop:5157 length:324 start_codon:yes stop_codon:yes gene_type:complete
MNVVKDVNDYVRDVESREETEQSKGRYWGRREDADGVPIVPKVYPRTGCEHCGEFFEVERDVSTEGTAVRLPKYCSDECKHGAAKSRQSEEQRQIDEYLTNNPVREW